ncbi:hypothetical protein ACF044_10860 [Microbacterium sp. NPDC016588]
MKNYLAALLPGIIILFGGLQTALADERIDAVEGGQLLALTAGVLLTYVVPLVQGRWAGLLKTGSAILAAVATLIIPLLLGFTWQALVIFALAALSALATEIGVQVRNQPTPATRTLVQNIYPNDGRDAAANAEAAKRAAFG